MERRGWGEPGWAGGGLHPSAGPGLEAAGPGPHPRGGKAAFLAFLLSFPHCLFVCFKLEAARNSFCLLDSAVLEPPPGRATEPSSALPGPPRQRHPRCGLSCISVCAGTRRTSGPRSRLPPPPAPISPSGPQRSSLDCSAASPHPLRPPRGCGREEDGKESLPLAEQAGSRRTPSPGQREGAEFQTPGSQLTSSLPARKPRQGLPPSVRRPLRPLH